VNAQSVVGTTTGISAGEQAVAQRVQQVQALIEAAGQVASGNTPTLAGASSSPAQSADAGGFASVLQAATAGTGVAAAGTAGTDVSGIDGSSVAASGDASGVVDTSGIAGSQEFADQSAQGAGVTAGSGEYESLIDQAAARNGVNPDVLHGLIEQESGFDPSATSSAGASGLTQLMPGTAASLGVANPLNPAESIEGGARYLGQLTAEFGGNTEEALAAYNAGPGAVQRYGGVPPYAETQSYVSKVLDNAEAYRRSHPASATVGSLI
jgi:soluble lytic murein transglycosylase-like protein